MKQITEAIRATKASPDATQERPQAPGVNLSPGFLLRGAFYALEQAGWLLRDSVSLYSQRRYPSSVALAAFCREEMGRTRIILDARQRALQSEAVALRSLRKQCTDHVAKLRLGQLTVNVTPPPRNLRTITWQEVGRPSYTSEDEELFEELERIQCQAREMAARRTHRDRLCALYVDVTEDGRQWIRPSLFLKSRATWLLHEVSVDYALLYYELRSPRDPELATAVARWRERPTLPPPILPDLDWE